MAKKLTPVTVWGIEFDALIDETKTMTATIPAYPVEDGFPVSDTIILDPISVSLTLYISHLYQHGNHQHIHQEVKRYWILQRSITLSSEDKGNEAENRIHSLIHSEKRRIHDKCRNRVHIRDIQ